MKISKYKQFINEEFNDTPESYIEVVLKQLKRKIDNIFENQEDENIDIEKKKNISIKDAKSKGKDQSKLTFKDLGVKLESSEISKYSKLYDSLTVKFSDDEATYNLFISIDLKDAIPKDDKNFSSDDIKDCYIKFKKYDLNTFEVIGQVTKNIKIDDINEDFLVSLKIDIDDKFGDKEEFKIET